MKLHMQNTLKFEIATEKTINDYSFLIYLINIITKIITKIAVGCYETLKELLWEDIKEISKDFK